MPPDRRRILATNGHLCVHTIGSFGLLGLGHSFHVPKPGITRLRTVKPAPLSSSTRLPSRTTIDVRVRTGLLRGPSHLDGLQRVPRDYITWSGGWEGCRRGGLQSMTLKETQC